MSDAIVRAALREVQRHGLERDLLVTLLREQAAPADISWTSMATDRECSVSIRGSGDLIEISQPPANPDLEALEYVAVYAADVLDLILSLARFIPASPLGELTPSPDTREAT